jgi:hypothetical protein
VSTTVRELIEGPNGQILRPTQLTFGRQIVVFRGRCRWTGTRFHVTPGSQSPYKLIHYGIVDSIETVHGSFFYLSYRGPDRYHDVLLGEYFALDLVVFDRAFPGLKHRIFPGTSVWSLETMPTLLGA